MNDAMFKVANLIFDSVPEPEPECRIDGDCPSRLACLNEVCRNPCTSFSPCGQNAECSVQNTLPQRTMVCMCLPGYVGDADVACNLRKIINYINYFFLFSMYFHRFGGDGVRYNFDYIDGIPSILYDTLYYFCMSMCRFSTYKKYVSSMILMLTLCCSTATT